MLHQPITEDPDVATAVEDFRSVVIEIRIRSNELFRLADDSPHRDLIRSQIEDRVADMTSRCERLAITIDDLFRLVNADLAARPPAQGHAHKPIGEFERHLLDENTRAHAAERQLQRELTALQGRIGDAADARIAADRACAGYVAGWAVRGGLR